MEGVDAPGDGAESAAVLVEFVEGGEVVHAGEDFLKLLGFVEGG